MSGPEPRAPFLAGRVPLVRPGLRIEAAPLDLVQLSATRGGAHTLAATMRGAFGLDLPPPGKSAKGDGVTTLWLQPDTWLVAAPPGTEGALAARLREAAGAAGSVVDQTHGRTVLTVSGADARQVMAKGCRLDLHPSVFAPGDVASTRIAHVVCLVHQTDLAPTYQLIVFTSLARSFLDWLAEAAAG